MISIYIINKLQTISGDDSVEIKTDLIEKINKCELFIYKYFNFHKLIKCILKIYFRI